MKRNIIKNIFVATLFLFTAVSCDDYLNEVNPNSVTTANFWKDLDDVQAGLNSTYASLRTEAILNIRYEALRSDLAWPSASRPSDGDEQLKWYSQDYNGGSDPVMLKWDALYTGVWRCNQVIEGLNGLENSGVDKERWTYQMAQARFLRGVFYFYLHSSFNEGKVIIKDSCPVDQDDFHKGVSKAEDVLAFFRADLQYAVKNLPNTITKGSESIPTKATAQTILGTSYLYEYEYPEAKEMFRSVIEEGPYTLETDMKKMFTEAGEFNSESIFEIPYTRDLHPELGPWVAGAMTSPLATFSKMWFVPSSWISVAYIDDKPDPKQAVNNEKNPSGVTRKVSLRASAMIALITDDFTPYYVTGNAAEQKNTFGGPNAGKSFGRYKKYQNHDILAVEIPSLSGRNVTVNRLSDVYLMYAECLLEEDNIQGALDYINEVRARWALVLLGSGNDGTRTYDDIVYTKQSLMDHLMYEERPLELSVEGHQIRWQDLRRWGLLEEDDNNIFKKRSEETYYAFAPSPTPKTLTNTPLPSSSAMPTGCPNYSTVSAEWPKNSTGANMVASGVVTIDYEYVQAYRNYSKFNNLFFPLPSDEIRDNSEL